MNPIANIPFQEDKKRIVIIGGGFAGLQITKILKEHLYQVVLLDKINYFQFQPLMYQVATGGLEPSSIAYPNRKRFQKHYDFHFRMCEVNEVVSDEKQVNTSIGSINYDYLVIATGCSSNYFGNDSLSESTYGLKSISEALLMRNRILLSLEEAINSKTEQELKECLTFVIVGGGATGVELAGALLDMRKSVFPKDYPKLDISKIQIHLVDGSPRLLSAMSENASKAVKNTLSKRGIILHQNTHVKSYNAPYVEMSNGDQLCSKNVFWVAGVKPNSIAGLKPESYNRGRLLINTDLTVVGYKDIFCVGDTSILISDETPKGHPQVAQVAIQMSKTLGNNLNAIAANKKSKIKTFKYKDKGSLATIGRNAAVADIGKMQISGIFAWWLWLMVHILSIVGTKNKVSVFLDWVWNYLRYDASLRILIKPTRSNIYSENEGDTKTT